MTDQLNRDLDAGPICPFDGRAALLHYAGLDSWMSSPRSFREPLPLVKHAYEECQDCDGLISYHHEGVDHCRYCGEGPGGCNGTPERGGNVPSHEDWPEGREWWNRVIAVATGRIPAPASDAPSPVQKSLEEWVRQLAYDHDDLAQAFVFSNGDIKADDGKTYRITLVEVK